MLSKTLRVLLVEDNPGDIALAMAALRDCRAPLEVSVACDGEEALDMLRRNCEQSPSKLPDLVLLDLNMPRRNGLEVLAEVKEDRELKHIPVMVVTSSQAEHDVLDAYQLHANCYIPKPIGLDDFRRIVGAIDEFWFSVVKLPSRYECHGQATERTHEAQQPGWGDQRCCQQLYHRERHLDTQP